MQGEQLDLDTNNFSKQTNKNKIQTDKENMFLNMYQYNKTFKELPHFRMELV